MKPQATFDPVGEPCQGRVKRLTPTRSVHNGTPTEAWLAYTLAPDFPLGSVVLVWNSVGETVPKYWQLTLGGKMQQCADMCKFSFKTFCCANVNVCTVLSGVKCSTKWLWKRNACWGLSHVSPRGQDLCCLQIAVQVKKNTVETYKNHRATLKIG